jgi:hypothetical protein
VRDIEDFSSALLQKSVLMLPQAGVHIPLEEQFRYLSTHFRLFLHFNNHQQESVSYIVIYCLFRPWNISKFDTSPDFAYKSRSKILSPPTHKTSIHSTLSGGLFTVELVVHDVVEKKYVEC